MEPAFLGIDCVGVGPRRGGCLSARLHSDTAQLAGTNYQVDGFHHWDFYAVAGALAFRHGCALNSDFACQYGVGWPLTLAFFRTLRLSRIRPLWIGVVWGGGVLRRLICLSATAPSTQCRVCRRRTASALQIQLYTGTHSPKWVYPSSTVLRCGLDVFFFTICLLHATRGRNWLGMLAGIAPVAHCFLRPTQASI